MNLFMKKKHRDSKIPWGKFFFFFKLDPILFKFLKLLKKMARKMRYKQMDIWLNLPLTTVQ